MPAGLVTGLTYTRQPIAGRQVARLTLTDEGTQCVLADTVQAGVGQSSTLVDVYRVGKDISFSVVPLTL